MTESISSDVGFVALECGSMEDLEVHMPSKNPFKEEWFSSVFSDCQQWLAFRPVCATMQRPI